MGHVTLNHAKLTLEGAEAALDRGRESACGENRSAYEYCDRRRRRPPIRLRKNGRSEAVFDRHRDQQSARVRDSSAGYRAPSAAATK